LRVVFSDITSEARVRIDVASAVVAKSTTPEALSRERRARTALREAREQLDDFFELRREFASR
jgi:hypothetical protein